VPRLAYNLEQLVAKFLSSSGEHPSKDFAHDLHIIIQGEAKDKAKDDKKDSSSTKPEEPGTAEGAPKTTPSKPHRTSHPGKKISHSFTAVINQLLEVVLHYTAPQSLEPSESPVKSPAVSDEVAPMDVDTDEKGKAKVEEGTVEKKEESGLSLAQRAEAARALFVLRLLTEFCLLYSSCLSVVLRRDWESSQGKGTGLLHHILHQLVTYRPPGTVPRAGVDSLRLDSLDLLKALPVTASSFLNAICLRSSEGRKRLVTDMAKALLSIPDRAAAPGKGDAVPEEGKVDTLIGLALNLLSVGPTTNVPGPAFSAETLKTTVEAGMVQSLTHVLSNVDLDHPRAPQLVNKILKALEALTRVSSSMASQGPVSRVAHGRTGTSARTEGAAGRNEAPVAAIEASAAGGEERAAQVAGTGTGPTGAQPAAEEERPVHDEEQDRMDHDRLNQHLQRMAVNRMAERDRYRELTEDLNRMVEDIRDADEEEDEASEDEEHPGGMRMMGGFVGPAGYEDEDEGPSDEDGASEPEDEDEEEGDDDENDDENDGEPEEGEEDDPDGDDEHLDVDHGPLTDEEGVRNERCFICYYSLQMRVPHFCK
jgi:hypothetical protein